MKTEIFYFSGTGNSLYVASQIDSYIDNSKLTAISRVVDKDYKIDEDITDIGFVFPLYYLSFPEVVIRFINQLDIPKNLYIFTVVTRAYPPVGGVLNHMRGLLKGKYRDLDLGIYINMPNNDLILFNTFKKKRSDRVLRRVKIKLPNIISMIERREKKVSFEPLRLLRPFRHNSFLERLKESDKNYHVTMKCNGCGVCERTCPVSNITMENLNPVWGCDGRCQECEGCINLCPMSAIEYGKKSLNKKRYFNPDVKIKELMEQNPYYSMN